MKIVSHAAKVSVAVFAVFLAGGMAVIAQVPGAGGPAGMSAAITKLFGDIKAFTAKADVQVLDNAQKEMVSMPMDFALLDKNVRVEMDLTQMKNKQMPPGMVDSLKQRPFGRCPQPRKITGLTKLPSWRKQRWAKKLWTATPAPKTRS